MENIFSIKVAQISKKKIVAIWYYIGLWLKCPPVVLSSWEK